MIGRRPVVVRRGPGLLGAAARTAVVAGTATAVSGGIRRRQNEAAQAPQPQQQQQAAPPPAADDSIAELERLAALKQQGVLSDAEFAAAKAKVLGL